MQAKHASGLTLIIVISLILALVALPAVAHAEALPFQISEHPVAPMIVGDAGGNAPGIPAIHPTRTVSSNVVAQPGISSTVPYTDQAAYTTDDVRRFIDAHAPRTLDGKHIIITTIAFLPAGQVSALLHGESTDRPDNVVECYVELHGIFSTAGIHRPVQFRKVKPTKQNGYKRYLRVVQSYPPAHVMVEVFDAQSGNLLLSGFTG